MDKYEYRVKTEQMLSYMDKKAYKKAMEIADTIDWRRVKNASMLCSVSEIYENNGEYQKSRDVLFVAYDRSPGSRKIIYRLGILALKMNDINEATDCYEEFVQLAPKDPNQFILKYKILRAQKAPLSQQIDALVNFKKSEYVEKWAFELAKLYHEAGMTAECLEECDDLILWFSEGKYVYQAMELKMRYKPLTPAQQEKYRQRSEGKSAHFGKIATIRKELPTDIKPQSEKTEKDIDSEAAETEMTEEKREVISEKASKLSKESVNEGNEEDVKESHVKNHSSEVKHMGTQEAFIKTAGSKRAEESVDRAKSNLSQKTGTMKIEEILQNWEAQQREAERAIEAEKEKYKEETQKKVSQDTVQILSADIQKLLDELEGKESEKDDLLFEMPEEEAAEELTSEEINDLLEEPEEEPEFENKAELVEALFVLDEEEDIDESVEEEFDEEDEPYEIDEDFLESDEELELPELEEDEELELSELEEEEFELDETEEEEFVLDENDEEDLQEEEFDADYEVEDDFFEDETDVDFQEDEEDDFIENPTPMEEPEEDDEYEDDFEEDSEDEDDEYEEELDFDEEEDYEEEVNFDEEEDYEEEVDFDEEEDYEEEVDFDEEEDYEEEVDFDEEEDYEEEVDFDEEEDYEEEADFDEYPEEEYEELEEEIEEEEEPIEEIEEIEDTQSMIKRSPGGVVLDTGFVVQGRYDLEAQSEIGLKAGLTEEQKKLFSYFVPVRGMSEQIVDVLEADKRCKKRFGTSRTGNIVIVAVKEPVKLFLR